MEVLFIIFIFILSFISFQGCDGKRTKHKLYFMILLLRKYVRVDQPFTIYVPNLLNHKIEIIGKTVVRIVVHMCWTLSRSGF